MKHIIFIAIAFFSMAANALDLELSVGTTKFGQTDNGIWYQNGFDHTLDLQSPSYSIGVSTYLTSGMRGRLEYTYLGNTSIKARGVADANYNGVDGCNGSCWNINHYHTSGSVRGFSATLAPEWSVGGGYKVFIEGGLFVFLPKFVAQAGETEAVVWQNEYREGWQTGLQLGGGVQHGNTQFVLTAYNVDAKTPDENAIPNWQGLAFNVKLRQLF